MFKIVLVICITLILVVGMYVDYLKSKNSS